jgi:glycosyltransferase involved in cell wall biosynthesis
MVSVSSTPRPDLASPRVSVGMVVHNGDDFLEQALDSLLNQTFKDFELIISDNASMDDTERICRAFAERDERIRYVRQPRNLGPGANFRYVLDAARGEFFMWAAHDDCRAPTCIVRLVERLDRNPRAVLASCDFDNIDYQGRTLPRVTPDWQEIFSGPKAEQFARFIRLDEVKTQKANHYYGLVRRTAIRNAVAAALSVDTYSGNDNCTLLALLGLGEFAIVPEVLFHYRIRPPVPGRRAAAETPLLSYVWRRLFGRSAGHDGNFLGVLRRSNEYFRGLRMVVSRQRSLSRVVRLYLKAVVVKRQLLRPIQTLFASARHELRGSN